MTWLLPFDALLFRGVFVLICGFQKFGQGVELVFPEGAVMFDPAGGVFHRLGIEAAAMNASVDFATEQSGRFEDAKMLGDGRQRNVEWGGQFRDGGFALGKTRENGAASGVGESAEGSVQEASGIVNHVV
jgi:hypothetical protein